MADRHLTWQAGGVRQFVALKLLKIAPDDIRDYGDPVPEANDWADSAVKAMIHLDQLGIGPPPCDHEAQIAELTRRVDQLVGDQGMHQAAASAMRDERDAAQERLHELEAQLAEATAPKPKPAPRAQGGE